MKKAKEARGKLPEIVAKQQRPARKNSPKKPALTRKGAARESGSKWATFWFVVFVVAWTFVSLIVSQLVVGKLMLWVLGAEKLSQPVWTGVYSLISYALALASIFFVPPLLASEWSIKKEFNGKKISMSGHGESLAPHREELGLAGTPTWTDIGLAPIGFIAATLGAGLLIWMFGALPWFDASEAQQAVFNYYLIGVDRAIAFIVLVVLAPIVEEVIFRGWLYGKLRSRVSAPLSILIVSALFGLVHFQWNVGVNVFALSVVACVFREITGTIYAGILTHMIKNGVAFYLLYVMTLR